MGVQSSRLKDELASHMAADALNNLGWHMGIKTYVRYHPHCDQFQIKKFQANREAILRENAELYKARRKRYKERHEIAGQWPMRIPELDWQVIQDACKDITGVPFAQWPKEEQAAYLKNVYNERPEYRIG